MTRLERVWVAIRWTVPAVVVYGLGRANAQPVWGVAVFWAMMVSIYLFDIAYPSTDVEKVKADRTWMNLIGGLITLAAAPIVLWYNYTSLPIYEVYVFFTIVACILLGICIVVKVFQDAE